MSGPAVQNAVDYFKSDGLKASFSQMNASARAKLSYVCSKEFANKIADILFTGAMISGAVIFAPVSVQTCVVFGSIAYLKSRFQGEPPKGLLATEKAKVLAKAAFSALSLVYLSLPLKSAVVIVGAFYHTYGMKEGDLGYSAVKKLKETKNPIIRLLAPVALAASSDALLTAYAGYHIGRSISQFQVK
jgi:hypothetical protein